MEIITLDTETTGPDAKNDKIVTLFLGKMNEDGTFVEKFSYLFNPGTDILEAATAVHGITNEYAQEHGIHPDNHKTPLEEIRNYLLNNSHLPIVVYNAPFDLTLLNKAFIHNNLEEINFESLFIFDPFIVDKSHDRYRSGSRKLSTVAEVYGTEVDTTKAHSADYDCYLAGTIAFKLLNHPQYKNLTPKMWMVAQKTMKKDQAESLQAHLRSKTKDNTIIISPEWPVFN